MEIVETREGSILILEPVGPLDRKTSVELQQRVGELIDAGSRLLVVDLSRTDSIAGAGIRVLLMLSRKLESMDGRLVLCAASPELRRSFDVAGIGRMLAAAGTRAEAIRNLSGDQAVARVSELALDLLARSDELEDL